MLSLPQVPKPRSGVAMCLHTAEDAIYIYGGYSKVRLVIYVLTCVDRPVVCIIYVSYARVLTIRSVTGMPQEKVTGSFKEGKVHEDVWVLQLKPGLATAGAAGGQCRCLM